MSRSGPPCDTGASGSSTLPFLLGAFEKTSVLSFKGRNNDGTAKRIRRYTLIRRAFIVRSSRRAAATGGSRRRQKGRAFIFRRFLGETLQDATSWNRYTVLQRSDKQATNNKQLYRYVINKKPRFCASLSSFPFDLLSTVLSLHSLRQNEQFSQLLQI